MKKKFNPIRMLGLALVSTLMVVMVTGPSSAYNRIFDLHLVNGARNDPVTFKISAQNNSCYEGDVGVGQQIGGAVPAGGYVTVTLARVQGHGCDGKQGVFAIEMSNQPNVLIRFNFDNEGHLQVTNRNSSAFGTLSQKRSDESYVFQTIAKPQVTAGKAYGQWILVCQQFCNKTFRQEITNTTTNTTETSSEVKDALSVTLEAGIEFAGGSAGTSITASQERTVGQRMSQELSTAGMTGTDTVVALTLEQMEERGLFAVWQWVATTRLSNGQAIVLTTVKYTCTPGGESPAYLPGSVEDVNSCQKRSTPVAAAPPASPPRQNAGGGATIPSRAELVPSVGGTGPVTQFALLNDTRSAVTISWIDGAGKEYLAGDGNVSPGQSWLVQNGAKTYETHWFSVRTRNRLLCSISLRQGASVSLSNLTACQI